MRLRRVRALSSVALIALTSGCLRPTFVGLRYSPSTHPSTIGDVYLATGEFSGGSSVGTIIFVHGGAFTTGSRDDVLRYAGPLLGQTLRGWNVVSIDYRFDPYPAAAHDLADAIRFVQSSEGEALGLSSRRIVVAGHSAGAAIAADVALGSTNGVAGPLGRLPRVDGWISAGGLLDFDTPGPLSAYDAWQSRGKTESSPVTQLDVNDPPGLVIHGARDPIVSVGHALRFLEKSQRIGHRTTHTIFNDNTDCSGHLPMCEAVRPSLQAFLDGIAR